ncbi:type I 3-dehydroquinate dehydratase [Leuconostocaceae bacterium ESL0958]|nr:type I 3-dehydroquinate dehydratase [Leuconostocaceae bacterium ESL0958]
MTFSTVLQDKAAINQALLAVPMALGPNEKLTPFQNALATQNPDAVIWQADTIADDFSKEVVWDQVKEAGAQALAEGDLSAMAKAAKKAELDQAQQEFLANWPAMQVQIVEELLANAVQTAGDHFLLLAYDRQDEGGQGEMSPADQTFFLVTALKASQGRIAAVYLPADLDENLQEKIQVAAKEAGASVIITKALTDPSPKAIAQAFEQGQAAGADLVNLAIDGASLSDYSLADIEDALSALPSEQGTQPMVTLTGLLAKDQVEAWLVWPSAIVTLALGERYQTAKIKSTVAEIGWS